MDSVDQLSIQNFNINITNNLRGLSIVNKDIMWASGTNGLVIRTIDGGKSWDIDTVNNAQNLDFRSIKAFDANTALVVSAGTPATIYRTTDGGNSWDLCWSNADTAVFLDAIDFWDHNNGLVMGDPINGIAFLLKTSDGGKSWEEISSLGIPKSMNSEGGFAASGSCLVLNSEKHAWFATGGDAARVYRSVDSGDSWKVVNTPILSGSPMKGIYSLAFKDSLHGIAVGGEWNVEKPIKSRAFTIDGGQSWTLGQGVNSYCSGSCFVAKHTYLACGQSGIDISRDGGVTWANISNLHLYGLSFDSAGEIGYGTGPSGRLVKLSWK